MFYKETGNYDKMRNEMDKELIDFLIKAKQKTYMNVISMVG